MALTRSVVVTFANLILLSSSEEVLVGFKCNCVSDKNAVCAIDSEVFFYKN